MSRHRTARTLAAASDVARAGGPAPRRAGANPWLANLADAVAAHSARQDTAVAREPGRPHVAQRTPAARGAGLPERLKAGVEALSGVAMDEVRVHRNSAAPARVGALAYAQGQDIHLGPGQEKHLPHEAWHVVQQAQGRVQATRQLKGVAINDDEGLEREADAMGARALAQESDAPVQRMINRLERPLNPAEDLEATTKGTANYRAKTGHGREDHGKRTEVPDDVKARQAAQALADSIDAVRQLRPAVNGVKLGNGAEASRPIQRKVQVPKSEFKDEEIRVAAPVLATDHNTEVVEFEDTKKMDADEILIGHGTANKVGGYDADQLSKALTEKTDKGQTLNLTIFSCKMGELNDVGSHFPQEVHDAMAKQDRSVHVMAPKKSIFVFGKKNYGLSESNLWKEKEFIDKMYSEKRLKAITDLLPEKIVVSLDQLTARYDAKEPNAFKKFFGKEKNPNIGWPNCKKALIPAELLAVIKNAKPKEDVNKQKWYESFETLLKGTNLFGDDFSKALDETTDKYTLLAFEEYGEAAPAEVVKKFNTLKYDDMLDEVKALWTKSEAKKT